MKSTIKEIKSAQKEPKFPVLKKWMGDGNPLIVLFTGETEGFVACPNGSFHSIGYGSERRWISCFDKKWVDFEGQVILEN